MKNRIIYILSLVLLLSISVQCTDQWQDRIDQEVSDVNLPILTRLASETKASVFLDLLRTSGLDKTLDGRNAYTVFAPTNESIQSLVSSLKANPENLKAFVRNHIAVSAHRLNTSADTVQLTMLSGKILDLVNSKIANIAFATSNQGTSDGLYHVINGPLTPQQNLWEYISTQNEFAQNEFIAGLNTYNLLTPNTNDIPTDSLLNNEYLHEFGDLRIEKNRYTYFVFENDVFEAEVNKFLPYVNYRNEADSSLQISKYFVVKDLLFAQAYDKNSLPAELVSLSGVHFPVDKNAIVETIALSNGYVHILSSSSLPVANKLTTVIMEGENFNGTTSNVPNATFVREKKDPNGHIFKDLMIQNHGVSNLGVRFELPYLLSTNYDVYWRAVNDIQSNVFQQRIIMTESYRIEDQFLNLFYPTIHEFPFTNVELRNYNEVYLGEFELSEFRRVNAFLRGNTVTTNGNNTIVADYLRFVPKVKQN